LTYTVARRINHHLRHKYLVPVVPTIQPRPTSVRLDLTGVVEDQAPSDRDESVGNVTHANMQQLEQHQARVKALEAALIEGEQSGQPRPIDFEAFKARMRARYSALT